MALPTLVAKLFAPALALELVWQEYVRDTNHEESWIGAGRSLQS
jgi:hypothetical protein